jgi:DNA-binding transcriptional regulator LsrR (DeoR family)
MDAHWRSVKVMGRQKGGWQYYCLSQQILVLSMCVDTAEACQALMEDPELPETLKAGEKADFVIAGIGSVVADHSTLVEAGYLSADELGELAAAGVRR